jgi:ribosomal protein L15
VEKMQSPNPLKKYFRQPKVYITLPSRGKFYPQGSIDYPENGELAVYAMTAKDELIMKTPDALLNGQATVDLIQSCVPNIKNAWEMPTIDLDAILVAIRIATYGEQLEITSRVPKIGDERTYTTDLRKILNKLVTVEYNDTVKLHDMTVKIKPLTYKEFSSTTIKTFEEQRIFRLVNNDKIPDEEKLAKFNESFKKLTDITVNTINYCIHKIIVDDTEVSDRQHIKEFVDNADKNFFSFITEHLNEEKRKFQIEPMRIISPEEDVERGAPEEFTVPIAFDQSNFFV